MQRRFIGQTKLVSKGPFLLSEITETPDNNLMIKLIESEKHAMMERVLMAVRTEIGLKLARQNGTEFRQTPFTYEYYPDTLSFIIKPVPGILSIIEAHMRYLLPPGTSENNNSPRGP